MRCMTSATEFAPGLVLQGFNAPLSLYQFKLIAFDMDSTLISIECVDEIADAVGRKAEVAAITEAAMRGEITDFKDSLRRRLALLKGVTLSDMERVYTERLKINPGAAELIAFDMDSTLISIECVDEIADAVGRKAEVAAITEAAMRGEITDF